MVHKQTFAWGARVHKGRDSFLLWLQLLPDSVHLPIAASRIDSLRVRIESRASCTPKCHSTSHLPAMYMKKKRKTKMQKNCCRASVHQFWLVHSRRQEDRAEPPVVEASHILSACH